MSRYQTLSTPDVPRGAVTRGWDLLFRRTVALKAIPAGVAHQRPGARLAETWEHWYGAPHAGLLRPGLLDFSQNLLVREWAHGFSLLSLLRQRRKLKAAEALALLSQLAPALDFAAQHSLLAHLGLDKVFVSFPTLEGDAPPTGLLEQPLAQWPPWVVKLDPLRLASLFESEEGQTAAGGFFPHLPKLPLTVVVAHTFLRQLLGAPMSKLEAPCAALREKGNETLAAALQPGKFDSAQALHRALVEALPEDALPGSGVTLPRETLALSGATNGPGPAPIAVVLTAQRQGDREIRLVLAPEYRLGRSSSETDCTVRFPSNLPEHERLSVSVSRRHATLVRAGSTLALRDGYGGNPSRNGTFSRDGRLEGEAQFALTGAAAVQLGTHWRATIHPIFRSRPAPLFTPSAAPLPDLTPECPWEAVYITPWKGCATRGDAVWLLYEAGFGLSGEQGLVWDTEAWSTAPAAFCRRGEEVLLLNRREVEREISIDGRRLEPGTAEALRPGMVIKAGRSEWRVTFAAPGEPSASVAS